MPNEVSLIGTTIAGRYYITEQICSDGLVRLYSAALVDEPSEQVSLKLIAQEDLSDEAQIVALRHEALCLGRLSHANIVQFLELGVIKPFAVTQFGKGGYFLVTEQIRGQHLSSLYPNGCNDLEAFFQIALSLSSALDHAHTRGIKLNNICLSNVLVEDHSKKLKLVDFSSASISKFEGIDIRSQSDHEAKTYTASNLKNRDDFYDLGCLLYKLLMGHLPSSTYKIRDDLPKSLVNVIDGLICPKSAGRYKSALSLIRDLKEAKRMFRLGLQATMSISEQQVVTSLGTQAYQCHSQDICKSLKSAYQDACEKSGCLKTIFISNSDRFALSLNQFSNELKRQQADYLHMTFLAQSQTFSLRTFADSLNDYISKTLSLYPQRKRVFQANIKRNLGINASNLLAVIPALKSLISFRNLKDHHEKPIFAECATDLAEVKLLLAELLLCLLPDDGTLVIICENLNEADSSILQILKSLQQQIKDKNFILVASFYDRCDESSPERASLYLKHHLGDFEHKTIGALQQEQVGRFISDYLGFDSHFDAEFIKQLHLKSLGNRAYICEFLRFAIAEKNLCFDDEKKAWYHNLSNLNITSFTPQSLDIASIKLSSYDYIDRSLIEFAAVLGGHFSIDWLTFFDGVDTLQVLRAIRRAESDGLILRARAQEAHDLFGPLYRFSRYLIRNQIVSATSQRQRITWRDSITTNFCRFLHESKDKKVNLYLGVCVYELYGKSIEESKSFDGKVGLQLANSLRGAASALCEKKAFLRAEQFLKLAEKIIILTKEHPSLNECLCSIKLQLGDIDLARANYHSAILNFESSLQRSPVDNKYKAAAFKTVCAKLLVSSADWVADINSSLELLNLPKVTKLKWVWWKSWVYMAVTSLFGFSYFKRLVDRAIKMSKPTNQDPSYNFLDFYHLGVVQSSIFDLKMAINFQLTAIKLAKKTCFNIESVLRLIICQCVILDRLGFYHSANKLQAFVFRIAKALNKPDVASYLIVNRIIFTSNNRFDLRSIGDAMPKFITELEATDDRLLQAEVLIFEIYRNLLLFNFDQQAYYFHYLLHRYAKHKSAFYRGLAIYLFGLLIQGQKREIIKYVAYMKESSPRKHSMDAVCHEVVNAIIGLAAGKAKLSAGSYEKILRRYGPLDVGVINPYINDFILLFVSLFPSVYQSEFGLSVMNKAAYDMEYRRAFKSVRSSQYQKRSILRLGRSIIDEYMNTKSKHACYEKVVNQAQGESNLLVCLFAGFLNLRYQYQLKGRFDSKKLKRLYTFARKYRCRAIELLILRTFQFEQISGWGDGCDASGASDIASKGFIYRLEADSLSLVKACFDNELSVSHAFHQNMSLLLTYVTFESAELIFDQNLGSVPALYYKQECSRFDHTSILIHFSDMKSVTLINTSELSKLTPILTNQTKIVSVFPNSNKPKEFEQTYSQIDEFASGQETKLILNGGNTKDNQHGKSAIVAITCGANRLALLLIHGISVKSTYPHFNFSSELARFGSFMAVWLGYKHGRADSQQSSFARNQAHGGFLESCQWLDVWREGAISLDTAEDTHWYLGLETGPDRYVAIHAGFAGDTLIREQVAEDLWWTMLAIRTVIISRDTWDIQDWLDECSGFYKSQLSACPLSRIHFSLSIFERKSGRVKSCQIGDWRPIHIGAKVRSTISKKRFLAIGNEKFVPYVEHVCENMTGGVYILQRNIGLAEQQNIENTYEKSKGVAHWTQNKLALKGSLKENIAASQNTGYFLAACFKAKGGQNNVSVSKAS